MTSIPIDSILNADAHFRRLSYNDPNITESPVLIQAIGDATDPFEANALAYKVIVAGEFTKIGTLPPQEAGGKLAFGMRIPFDAHSICVDIVQEFADGTALLIRCIAKEERLYMEELPFWESAAQSKSIRQLIFTHEAELHPLDEQCIKRLLEQHQKVEFVHVGIPVPE